MYRLTIFDGILRSIPVNFTRKSITYFVNCLREIRRKKIEIRFDSFSTCKPVFIFLILSRAARSPLLEGVEKRYKEDFCLFQGIYFNEIIAICLQEFL